MLLPPPTRQERLRAKLEPSVLLAIRRVLRELLRDADALLAVLGVEQRVVEFAGDDAVMPRLFPDVDRTVPCYGSAKCRDGTEHDIAVMKVRIAPGWPSLGLFVVASGGIDLPGLSELVEDAAADVEELLAAAV